MWCSILLLVLLHTASPAALFLYTLLVLVHAVCLSGRRKNQLWTSPTRDTLHALYYIWCMLRVAVLPECRTAAIVSDHSLTPY